MEGKGKIKWSVFEGTWLVVAVVLSAAVSLLLHEPWIGLVASVTGILCVVLTAKGVPSCYLYGIVNVLAYAWLARKNGLYGEMGLNLGFFLPASFAGYFMWRRNFAAAGKIVMRRLSPCAMVLWALGSLVAIAAMGWGLSLVEGQNTPYVDATTNVLSVAATFLMLARYREQWLMYVVLDVFTVLMWAIRWSAGGEGAAIMVVMWGAYLVNACYGYWNWTKGSEEA